MATLLKKKKKHKMQEVLTKEGPYDGQPLTEEDLQKINRNAIKVVTYHPLTYLKKQSSLDQSTSD